ncbi:MAG: FtsX-like permease family protein, partial [Bacteroidota bacterium]
ATARSMRRSMEVGIRKVMGALRGTLIRQFIIESIVITLVSVFLSIGLLLMVTPLINAQLGTQLAIEELYSFRILAVLTGIIVVTGLLSGSYPAFYLSAFSPIKTIKGGLSSKKGGNVWVRRGLVGLQFAISMFMLVGTVIIYEQMQYVRNTSMGFDNEQVLTFELEGQASKQWNTLRNKLLAHPTITKASTSTTIPGRGFSKNVIPVETNEGVMEEYGIDLYGVDHEYFNVLSVELVAGRNFSKDHPTDTSQAVLVNEAMVSRMNWSDPIGKRFHINTESTVYHKVVGVVKNFHQRSFYDPINPLLFVPSLDNSNVLVKIEGDLNAGIAPIEATWSELFPGLPLEHQFLDQNFLRAYEEDQLRGRFFLGFACIMIIISGLGLLGLASFSAEQRTKEISIRKVLGANVKSLILLLIKDFLWLTVVGAIPAFVIGYQLMNSWLKDFEYHTEIRLISFIAVFLIVSIFVVLTTGIQAYRAAAANPSEKLKYE